MGKRKASKQAGSSRSKLPCFLRHSDLSVAHQEAPPDSATSLHVHRAFIPNNREGVSYSTINILGEGSPPKRKDPITEALDHDYPDLDDSGAFPLDHTVGNESELVGDEIDIHYQWTCHERSDKAATKRKRFASDDPLRQWIPYCQEWLDEMIRLEGRGEHANSSQCPQCHVSSPEYRCRECSNNALFCLHCTTHLHRSNPLHLIDRWNGKCFERTTLKALGLRVQLMHTHGHCLNPTPAPKGFVVIDVGSVQEVTVDYCGCQHAPKPTIQLLRSRWFPATVVTPSTAATHRVLANFHLSTLQSKKSAFDYYHAIERLTDNTELNVPPDRYEEFLRMVRMWRHLKLLKRAGRGEFPDGIATTKEGELALMCPACPQPGINLPDDWEQYPEEERWLFDLILSIDANFRLRRRKVSSDEADPPLGSGWAYFVERLAYKRHLDNYTTQPETSTCSNHSAISKANVKSDKGLATTGVGACVCARHQLLRPNGLGDLQRGERYCNMDYIVFSTLRDKELGGLVLSYDIACQWYKNLWKRMYELPAALHLDHTKTPVRFVIPKFHLPAHHQPCHAPFSFNYALGVGRTDGEGVERNWSEINPVSGSTLSMTPGHRADTLDDHWGDWNWRKITGMGRALARRIRTAIPESTKHAEAFQTMSDSLPVAHVEEWTQMVEAWERESALKEPRAVEAPNPYELKVSELTQAEVRLQLARDDAACAAAGHITMHECTPAQFIITGLELQEQQLRLRDEHREHAKGTAPQQASLQERRNLLTRKLDAWQLIQAIYMPGVPQLRTDLARGIALLEKPPAYIGEPEERKLYLPSEVSALSGAHASILRGIECQLREGQAYDALREVCHYVRLSLFNRKYKNNHCRGQRENTRASSLIERTEHKKAASVRRYRLAHQALVALEPEGPWSKSIRDLRDADVRGLSDPAGSESEGRRVVSWIWAVPGVGKGTEAEDTALHDSLRVEWCKARARASRWREEIQLLRAEMGRVDKWLGWRAEWWKDVGNRRKEVSPELKEGLLAHSLRQARINEGMRSSFADIGQKACTAETS